jgi:leucyl-tRNA synthetase
MRQWAFRMTAFADRLLEGLNHIEWPDAIKEHQRNWIGRSEGSSIIFDIDGFKEKIEVFSTRPDTLFGSTFMVLAPEHELLNTIVPPTLKEDVNKYVTWAKNRSEVERQQEVKKVTGIFTGAYALHPFTGKQIPIWTADYVLAGYGTGAIMAVPAHDERDYAFAKHFKLDIIEVVAGGNITEEAYEAKTGKLINSDFLNGLEVKAAITKMITALGALDRGKARVNYRLRDPNFSRQRYWGEPIPIVYRNDVPYALPESELPLLLPDTNNFHPSENGESPLSRLTDWVNLPDGSRRETNTMPLVLVALF